MRFRNSKNIKYHRNRESCKKKGGVGLYIEAYIKGVPEVIYIPVRFVCEFHPYQKQYNPPSGVFKNSKEILLKSLSKPFLVLICGRCSPLESNQ